MKTIILILSLLQVIIFAEEKGNSTMKDNCVITINSGKVSISADPQNGGLITSFKLGDYEFITQKKDSKEGFGSTVWPSPQSVWNWPPPAVLDRKPYTVENLEDTVKMTSGEGCKTGFQLSKEIVSGKENSIKLKYEMKNISNEVKKTAVWEISRAPKGGMLFYPIGAPEMGVKFFPPVDVKNIDGIIWFDANLNKQENHKLSYGDGKEGWLAYAINNKLFIKKFDDILPAETAPGEGEILYYSSFTCDYIEIEVQGKYAELAPGKSVSLEVEWIGIEIPEGIKVEAGNKELVEFVRSVIK